MIKKIFLATILSFTLGGMSYAQGGFDPPIPPEDEIPVDGGISFLLLSGIAFGLKKLKS